MLFTCFTECMITNINYSPIKIQKQQAPAFKAGMPKGAKQLACDSLEISSKKVQYATGLALSGIIAGLMAKASKPQEITLDDVMKSKESGDLNSYKEKLIKFLEDNHYDECREEGRMDLIEEIKNSQSIEDVDFNVECIASRCFDNYVKLTFDDDLDLENKIINQDFSPELDDFLNKRETIMSDKVIPLLELTSQKDTDKEVLQIKQELQQKYGIEKLYCDNNIEFAKCCKEAFKILNENGINIPKIIIGNAQQDLFGGLNAKTSKEQVVVVKSNPNTSIFDFDLKHVIIHEILHTTQPRTLAFKTRVIPEDMIETANNVSDYAAGNTALEVHCELYTKKLLEGLSPEEEKLFNYLGGALK